MSIYGTFAEFWIEDDRGKPLEVWCQVVPAWIDYEGPQWEWLPPNREWLPEWGDREDVGYAHPRAAFFVTDATEKGTDRCGQEYVGALLVLTGEEYERMPWKEVMRRLDEAVNGESR